MLWLIACETRLITKETSIYTLIEMQTTTTRIWFVVFCIWKNKGMEGIDVVDDAVY